MAKVFDEENVQHFWGLSPGIDVLGLLHRLPISVSQHGVLERLAQAEAINVLQVTSSPAKRFSSMKTTEAAALTSNSQICTHQ